MLFLTVCVLVQSSHCLLSKQDIIRENLAKIQQWNHEAGSSTKFAANQYLAYTEEETEKMLGIQEIEVKFPPQTVKSEGKLEQGTPSSFDWRWFDAVTSPRFSSVQSPFLEAAVNTIESAYFRSVE